MNDLQDAVTLADELVRTQHLKAWRIDCDNFDLLVFAENRNRARRLVVQSGPCDHEYQHVRALRESRLDSFADAPRVILCNEDLPAGCPPFWSEQ